MGVGVLCVPRGLNQVGLDERAGFGFDVQCFDYLFSETLDNLCIVILDSSDYNLFSIHAGTVWVSF